MVKAIVFDLGKVLLDFDYATAAQKIALRCNLTPRQLKDLLNQAGY